jgi:hypothetical protein
MINYIKINQHKDVTVKFTSEEWHQILFLIQHAYVNGQELKEYDDRFNNLVVGDIMNTLIDYHSEIYHD